MSWFDDQIKQRKMLDDEYFSDSFIKMAGAVMDGRGFSRLSESRIRVRDAIDEILKYYHVKSPELPDSINDVNEQLEFLLRPHGIMRRTVRLSDGWYKDAIGAMLAVRKDNGEVTALIPSIMGKYSFHDTETGKRVKINKKTCQLFEDEAIAFYKPFPLKKLGVHDLIIYMLQLISARDIALFAASSLALVLVARLLPAINNVLFGNVIEQGSKTLLISVAVLMVSVSISQLLLSALKSVFTERINTRLGLAVEAAAMMRLMSLPASFFKRYSSGELSSRVNSVSSLCRILVSTFIQTGLNSLFSLVLVSSIFDYAPVLVVPSLLILLAGTVFSLVSTFTRMKINKRNMELGAKESGMSYALISGVQKVKLAGAEKRAFARWGDIYAETAKLQYNPPLFIKIDSAITTGITLLGTAVLYTSSIAGNVSVANYFAFLSAYGMVSAAFSQLTGMTQSVAQIKPILDMVEPILETVPEVAEDKQVVTQLSGSIEFNNVSFKYDESSPNVIDDVSFKIRPGEYLAIVGKTGCGKSTLVRLILGFEKADSGAIFIDGKDIGSLDLKSLRRKIGVVMQEGKLFQGDLFSNIVISAPWLKLEDAWEAAELAGIADDIRNMPMGMFTYVSEGSGGISGGQRQRIMIARAVAPKPKLLIFDEATSALDNITQKKVSDALDGLKCTRIVIAHRLSTIKHCDRILCFDKGKIIESGTYDELMQANGFFSELVKRQLMNSEG